MYCFPTSSVITTHGGIEMRILIILYSSASGNLRTANPRTVICERSCEPACDWLAIFRQFADYHRVGRTHSAVICER